MASNITDIVVDDDYIRAMAEYIKKSGAHFENYYQQYIKAMEVYGEEATMDGETAKAVKRFVKIISKLRDYVQDATESMTTISNNYIENVDSADRELY